MPTSCKAGRATTLRSFAHSFTVLRDAQNTDAHRELLDRRSSDLIAGRCTLPEAAAVLADFSRQHTPGWLRRLGRSYPGRSEEAAVAASLVYYCLFRLHDGNPEDEETGRRLAADYRACYGAPLTLPEPAKGAGIPPFWHPVTPPSPLPSAEQRP